MIEVKQRNADEGHDDTEMPKENSQRVTPNGRHTSPNSNTAEQNNGLASPSVGKPKRVRTGCLTCRERHLKCDEGVPICQNCRKSSRKCKRGVRLNFIDTKCEQPPHLLPPVHDWKVTFEDNSREIASEYEGGIEKYSSLEPQRKRPRLSPPDTVYDYHQIGASVIPDQHLSQQPYQAYSDSSSMYPNSANQTFEDPNQVLTQPYSDHQRQSYDQSMMLAQEPEPPAPPLSSQEEVLYMQVFVEEVALWMDSMDKEKNFSRNLPFQALREPMLKYALLACGVRHLTLVNPTYPEEHAVKYYAESNKLLLKALQNPDRDTGLCATTATVLNVYEIMSETALQRMNHIAGARALIKECRWDGSSVGVGGSCFWLNVGMELFSCLHFNWGVAWDPDTWNVDMTMNPQLVAGNEEDWTHKILWILAKVTNFRSSTPRFQEQSVHAEQMRLQARLQTWLGLKQFADHWDECVPPTMHPMGLVPSYLTRSHSSFPEVFYIKRCVITARLFWHTAMILLASVHPLAPHNPAASSPQSQTNPQLANEMAQIRLHHSRQICGIVKHAKDRGIASASIRCLAVAGEHLHVQREQEEVLEIFERIRSETGWRVAIINEELKDKWGWKNTNEPFGNTQTPSPFYGQTAPAPPKISAPPRQKIPGGITNPLYQNADFASQNPPYAGNYVPPASLGAGNGYLNNHEHRHGNGTGELYRYGGITAI